MSIELFKDEIRYSEQYLKDIIANSKSEESRSLAGANNLLEAIKYIKYGLVANPALIKDMINPESASMGTPFYFSFLDSKLDDTQGLAVKKALAMNNILLIQGPPGAGKSTTIVEMIRQIKKKEPKSKILVTSQTHVAVDNVLEKLIKNNFTSVVRVAAKTETNDLLKDYYLASIFEQYRNSADPAFRELLDNFNKETPSNSDQTLDKVTTNILLSNQANKILLSRDVIGITANSLKRTNFSVADFIDYAIVDEVGKVTFAELMFIARFVKKLILIGDPNQLPAVLNQFQDGQTFDKQAWNHLADEPFINYLFDNVNPSCRVFLNKQYRMAKQIGNYISDCFYTFKDTKLQNGISTVSNPNALNFVDYNPQGHIVAGGQSDNSSAPLSNPYEVQIIKILLDDLKNRGVDITKEVAIISPYAEQVRLIRATFPSIKLENIDSVDAFQGRENKIVIFSCSRNKHVTEFFKKPNRINVAISRAISEIWIVGSKEFCIQVDHLKRYYYYNREDNDIRSFCNHYYFDGTEIKKSQP